MKKILVLTLSAIFAATAFGLNAQEIRYADKLLNAAEKSVDLVNDLLDNPDITFTYDLGDEEEIKPKIYLTEGEYTVFVNDCMCTLEIYSNSLLRISYDTPNGKVPFIEGYIYKKEIVDENTWKISYTDNGLYSFNLEYLWTLSGQAAFELY